MLIKQIIKHEQSALRYRKLRLFCEFLNIYWAGTINEVWKMSLALCLHRIKSMLLGSLWSLMRAEEDFFLHSEYNVTTGFLSDFSRLSAEPLEFGQSWRQTVGWRIAMFLKDWHSLSVPHTGLAHLTDVKTIVGYGIRMYVSSRHVLLFYVYYYSSFTAECGEGHFLKKSGSCL